MSTLSLKEFEIFYRLISFGTDSLSFKMIVSQNNDLQAKARLHFKWPYQVFEDELNESLRLTKWELSINVSFSNSQYDKLRFIRSIYDRTKALSNLIQNNDNNTLSHSNYHHSSGVANATDAYSEDDFQEFYLFMRWSCNSLLRHLEGLRQDVEATGPGGFESIKNVASVNSKNPLKNINQGAVKNSFSITRNPVNIEILRAIYNLELGHKKFIDSDKTTLTDFENYFTSKDLSTSLIKIYTACKVNEAAYIISQLAELFPGLEYSLIEKSEGLLKNNKFIAPFKAGDISSAISKIRNSDGLKEKKTIDNFFLELKKSN